MRAVVVVAVLLLAACGAPPGSPTPSPAPGASLSPSPVPTMPESPSDPVQTLPPTPSATATAVPTLPPTARPTPVPTPAPTASLLPASLAGAEWSRLPTAARVVALTFDAGGNDAGVASILATLAAQKVPATFFLTGRWCEVYPQQAARIAASYEVGNHTYSHPHLTAMTDAAVRDEVLHGERALRAATGVDPHPLFRFPYGDSDARTLSDVHALGYGGIRWTVDTWGWKGGGPGGQSVDTVVARVLGALAPGAIVLMHVGAAEDGTTLDAAALSRLIGELRARGYGFVSVGDAVR